MKPVPYIVKCMLTALIGAFLAVASFGQAEPRLRADGIVFPAASAATGLASGTVEVMVAVDVNGDPASITVLASTHKQLEDAVREAVGQWKFSPAIQGGQASIGMYRHAFHFKDGKFVVGDKLLESIGGAAAEPGLRADGVVLPELPGDLREVTGQVELLAAVDGRGRVIEISTAGSTNPKLEAVLRQALSEWVFNPVSRDGKPVAGLYRHKFRFENGQHMFTEKLWTVLSSSSNEPVLRADGVVLPELSKEIAGVSGNVDLMVAVNRSGRVVGFVSVAATDERLAASVKKAVTAWTFDPAAGQTGPVVGFYRHGFRYEGGRHIFDQKLWDVLSAAPVEPTLKAEGLTLPELPKALSDISARVDMLVAVDLKGQVASMTPVSEVDSRLMPSVNEAVKNWQFTPASKGGKPVIGLYKHTFRFEDGAALFDQKLWQVLSQAAAAPAPTAAASESAPGGDVAAAPAASRTAIAPSRQADPQVVDASDAMLRSANSVQPQLPAELRNIRGQVNLILHLRAGGAVSSVATESYTHEELIEPTVRAGFQWRFDPALVTREMKVRVPFKFNERESRVNWDNLIDAQFGKVDEKPEILRSVVPTLADSQRRVTGEIQALVAIDRYGFVTNVRIERGLGNALDSAAEQALLQWRFSPAQVGGRSVDAKLRQTFVFGGGVAKVDLESLDRQAEVRYSPKPRLRGSASRQQGFVLLRLRIDEQGGVVDSRVIESTSRNLEDPSVEASKEWRFTPAVSQGQPARSTVVVPFIFPMDDAG